MKFLFFFLIVIFFGKVDSDLYDVDGIFDDECVNWFILVKDLIDCKCGIVVSNDGVGFIFDLESELLLVNILLLVCFCI